MSYNINKLSKSFGNLHVIDNFDLEIEENKITCILGPSGCGKSTLLNIIGNLLAPDSGSIDDFTNKEFSYIFQEPRLLEWKTVYQNIAFAIKNKYPSASHKTIIDKYLKIVELDEFQDYYPCKLSGGMKQRTSIARAFSYPSDILLMDEPFVAIDAKLKQSLLSSFIKLWTQDKRTVIFVTHDINEAVLLSDNIYLLDGPPLTIKECYKIDIPQIKRSFQDKHILELSSNIYLKNIL